MLLDKCILLGTFFPLFSPMSAVLCLSTQFSILFHQPHPSSEHRLKVGLQVLFHCSWAGGR